MTEGQPDSSVSYESQIPTERLVEILQHSRQLLRLVNIHHPGYVYQTELLVDELARELELRGLDPKEPCQNTGGIEGAKAVHLS